MAEPAEEFVSNRDQQWRYELEKRKTMLMKDVGKHGTHHWVREAWTMMPQGDGYPCVYSIERLRYTSLDGVQAHSGGAIPGSVEYRFGYFTVGRNGRAKDKWVWAQFSPIIPGPDLSRLLSLALEEGTILADHLSLSG